MLTLVMSGACVVKPISPAASRRAASIVSNIARVNEWGMCLLRGVLLHHPVFPAVRCSSGAVKIVNSYNAANLFIPWLPLYLDRGVPLSLCFP